ncbi:YciI family protein [Roseibium sp.]|uniref:YciI family protein n=1 Tax=Roseibium sp. TaxID=1936156 RepID=UPI003B516437
MAQNLFVVDLTYVVPLDHVDPYLEPHRAFLQTNYEAGLFVASGPKEPRTGGIILARAESRDVIEAVLQQDPFKREGLAEYVVTEFNPVMIADGVTF